LGIKHLETPPYTPESNSRAERLNRVIDETARAMLIHANLPQQFWPEAVKTAVYTWNFLPHTALGDKTPHECYHKEEAPDLDHLRPFGCLAMVHIPNQRRRSEMKFESVSQDAIFMGNVSSSAWRVYNLKRKCFEVSHDVIFFETRFPSGKEFPHLRSVNWHGGGMIRTADYFTAPLVVASSEASRASSVEVHTPPVAPSSVATDVPPVMHDMIVVEPPSLEQAFGLCVVCRVHENADVNDEELASQTLRIHMNAEPTSYRDAMVRPDAKK
jgi:hypothetical protein